MEQSNEKFITNEAEEAIKDESKLINDIFQDDDDEDDEDFEPNQSNNDEVSDIPKKRKLSTSDTITDKVSKKPSLPSTNEDTEKGDLNKDDEEENDSENNSEHSYDEIDENEYQYDDFVVKEGESESDDEAALAEDSDDENNKDSDDDIYITKKIKKNQLSRLKKNKDGVRLDSEDLQLIQENLDHNRRRTADHDNDADEPEDEDFIEPIVNKQQKGSDEDEEEQMGEEEGEDGVARPPARRHGMSLYTGDDDDGSDMGDFIIDEHPEDEEDGDGVRKERPAAAPRVRRPARRDGPTFDQIKDATDIFGGDFDFDDEEPEEEEGEEGQEEDYDNLSPEQQEKKARERLNKAYDRHILVENFLTERDDLIRQTDRPERFQDILANRAIPDDSERTAEAGWMAAKLTHIILSSDPAVGDKSYFQRDYQLEKALVEPIQEVLKFFQVSTCIYIR